jgi:hypothetical protein
MRWGCDSNVAEGNLSGRMRVWVLGCGRVGVWKSCSKLSGIFLTCACLLTRQRIAGFDTDGPRTEVGWRIQASTSSFTAPSVYSPLSAVLNKSDIYSDPKISQAISCALLTQRLEFPASVFHVGFMVSKAKLKDLSKSVVTISWIMRLLDVL